MHIAPTGESCPACAGPLMKDPHSDVLCPTCEPDHPSAALASLEDKSQASATPITDMAMQSLPALAGVVLLLWVFAASEKSEPLLGIAAASTLLFAAFVGILDRQRARVLLARQRKHIESVSERYAEVLGRKRKQLIVKDEYGDEDDMGWRKEIVNFVNNKVNPFPENAIDSTGSVLVSGEEIAGIVDRIARSAQQSARALPYDDGMDGIEYEHFCASLLRDLGWDASVSQASGDQGIDIKATKNGIIVAIQCKKYSSPVGNKAVQEVLAGMHFAGADFAAVVTNASFTRSAKQLAAATDAILIHHEQLAELDRLLVAARKG